ncbi:nucleotide-binding domain-containing protein [Fibrobacter sp. HC4]|uniref:nucleotide-binding domain-containing protein n=1 Tax=Fibrobacter sp. HC4 TaxID=3239812 RepID=UPI0035BCB72A|nr:hypothetical protein [Fibrobacter succinogenes]
MYDMSGKFNAFYNSFVVLSQNNQNELYAKKDLNIQRLKDGLVEYNEENKTSYNVVETCVQGSVAMSTVVQNEDNDYDIDVAIVLNHSALGEKGAQATRNMIANALKRKTRLFNADPEVKTSCVRVKYVDGYHIDFAVYRQTWDKFNCCWKYEHAGEDWSNRELKGLTDWFKKKNNNSDGKLRQVVRLSKMFCNSRDSWVNMPSGLLQMVLCDEMLQMDYERIDELFYHTMKMIIERLDVDTSVLAPVDNGRNLTPRQSDIQKLINWKNRLKSKIEDLDVLFKDDCSECDALQAWYGFFNHEYWSKQVVLESTGYSVATVQKSAVRSYNETEEFIEDIYPVRCRYHIMLNCTISGDGWRANTPLSSFLTKVKRFIPHNFSVHCSIASTNVPGAYKVLWKVKNVGPEAQRRNDIRGQILERGYSITENTLFYGNHYIECYIIKDNVCVARQQIKIPIG